MKKKDKWINDIYQCAKSTSTKHRQKNIQYEKSTQSTLVQTDCRSQDYSDMNTNKVPSAWMFPLESSPSRHHIVYELKISQCATTTLSLLKYKEQMEHLSFSSFKDFYSASGINLLSRLEDQSSLWRCWAEGPPCVQCLLSSYGWEFLLLPPSWRENMSFHWPASLKGCRTPKSISKMKRCYMNIT